MENVRWLRSPALLLLLVTAASFACSPSAEQDYAQSVTTARAAKDEMLRSARAGSTLLLLQDLTRIRRLELVRLLLRPAGALPRGMDGRERPAVSDEPHHEFGRQVLSFRKAKSWRGAPSPVISA